jgi:uncharacterized protein YllA (UPF0747 family)
MVRRLTAREALSERDLQEEKDVPVKVRVIFEIPAEDGDVIEMEARTYVELSEDSVKKIKQMFFKPMSMSVTVVKREKTSVVIALDP